MKQKKYTKIATMVLALVLLFNAVFLNAYAETVYPAASDVSEAIKVVTAYLEESTYARYFYETLSADWTLQNEFHTQP